LNRSPDPPRVGFFDKHKGMLSSSWDGVEAGLLLHLGNRGAKDGRGVVAAEIGERKYVSSLEILGPILLSKFSKSVGDILVKLLYFPLMYWDFMSNVSSDPGRFLYSSVHHQRRVFLFLLLKLAIIKAAKLTTTTTREDILTKA
jgi:hypothetical protein